MKEKPMKEKPIVDWWKEVDPNYEFEKLPDLKKTKQLIKTHDPVRVPNNDEFFDNLHDRIMISLENRTIQPQTAPAWYQNPRLAKRAVAAMIALTIAVLGRPTHDDQQQDQTLTVLSDALQRSDIEDSILVYQHKNEFFVDLAAENLDHLTVGQLKHLMHTEVQN